MCKRRKRQRAGSVKSSRVGGEEQRLTKVFQNRTVVIRKTQWHYVIAQSVERDRFLNPPVEADLSRSYADLLESGTKARNVGRHVR